MMKPLSSCAMSASKNASCSGVKLVNGSVLVCPELSAGWSVTVDSERSAGSFPQARRQAQETRLQTRARVLTFPILCRSWSALAAAIPGFP